MAHMSVTCQFASSEMVWKHKRLRKTAILFSDFDTRVWEKKRSHRMVRSEMAIQSQGSCFRDKVFVDSNVFARLLSITRLFDASKG
jgi:hypothetical protein